MTIEQTIDSINVLVPDDNVGIFLCDGFGVAYKQVCFAPDLKVLLKHLEDLEVDCEHYRKALEHAAHIPNLITNQAYSKAQLVEGHYDGDVYMRAFNDGLRNVQQVAQAALATQVDKQGE